MDLTKISASEFSRILKLLQRKEELMAQIAAIDHELQGGSATAAPVAKKRLGRPPGAAKKVKTAESSDVAVAAGAGPRRGAVRDAIIALLEGAGTDGISVKDIAAKLGKPAGHVHTWFSTTGKSIPSIRRLGGGRWGWSATNGAAA
jgi:hypothetical protein